MISWSIADGPVEGSDSWVQQEEWRKQEEKRASEIAACPKHLWVIEIYEDEEDGHDLRCERCPAGESDLYDDPWETMEGEVAPGIGVDQLVMLKRRPRSFPVNIEVKWHKVGWEYPEYEAEILVSPRISELDSTPPPR